MKALVIAEHVDAMRELAAGARTMADEVVALSFGDPVIGIADKVVNVTVPEDQPLDDAAPTVISVFDAEQPEVVFVQPTRRLKVIAGRLAFHAKTAVVTDVMEFVEEGAKSMFFGGVAECVRTASAGVETYTVAPGAFGECEATGSDAVEQVTWVQPANPVKLISSKKIEKSSVDLSKTDVVVAAGRGFSDESQLDLARNLCEKIGGGLGCSRPLTEGLNWLPTELYVGVTGLMLSPKVYVACGISGQMQHMVGCNRATTFFAINKDKNAPIFKQCDYGLVGDVSTVLPQLVEALA